MAWKKYMFLAKISVSVSSLCCWKVTCHRNTLIQNFRCMSSMFSKLTLVYSVYSTSQSFLKNYIYHKRVLLKTNMLRRFYLRSIQVSLVRVSFVIFLCNMSAVNGSASEIHLEISYLSVDQRKCYQNSWITC